MWEPEDGRCDTCGAPLETAYEQDAGLCSFCHTEQPDDPEEDEDPINDFYRANGYF